MRGRLRMTLSPPPSRAIEVKDFVGKLFAHLRLERTTATAISFNSNMVGIPTCVGSSYDFRLALDFDDNERTLRSHVAIADKVFGDEVHQQGRDVIDRLAFCFDNPDAALRITDDGPQLIDATGSFDFETIFKIGRRSPS